MSKIFGVDPDGDLTALDVRDAILVCFKEAHHEYAQLSDEGSGKSVSKKYSEKIVKNAFESVDADFDNPTKDDLIKVVDYLAEFSKQFRDPEAIKENRKKIMKLINNIH